MPNPTGLTLDEAGYFSLNGRRFIPVGVNYWPASCGVEMWQRWPEQEIQHDLDLLLSLGLNTVRFFLRWQDFEPEASRYDPVMFARLTQILEWCSQRDLFAQPSLFVGWMSGGIFWPSWREGRNIFGDPAMIKRAAAFAQKAASFIKPFHAHLAGVDLGNELCCLPDSREAAPDAVIRWCRTMSDAIRSAYADCLIVSGNEQNQFVADTGWRFGQQPGTDFYSMHGYPVPTWHPVAFDGMTDPLCQSLLPFYTKVARTFGPVMVQEFGTIITFGQQQQDAYLRAVLPACWEAGANGFLWWCLRDITANVQPYLKNNFESTLGLVDGQDRVKPGLAAFVEFARSLADRPAPDVSTYDVGLYWPKHFYPRENPDNPGNDPRRLAAWMTVAHFLLQELGHRVGIVRGDLPIETPARTIVISGALLGADEAGALERWVRAGNHLVWHGPDPGNWGSTYARLLGAKPVDYRAAREVKADAFDKTWTFATYPRSTRVQVAPETAAVLAQDQDQMPLLLVNQLGRGTVVYALPLVEEGVARVAGERDLRARWKLWYESMLSAGQSGDDDATLFARTR